MLKTKVVTYLTERAMKRGIAKEEKRGWEVVNVQTTDRGRGFIKGCLFGIFSLFMRKPKTFMVTYRRATP